MATIYRDDYLPLKNLLAKAGKGEDATLLIPDLQRPYIWDPTQVVALVDSLIRGWPFGTLLTWTVKTDDPARGLARSFWRVVDRTAKGDGELISPMNPPATFQMVLDGQQRVQSLLLAFGGDGWGFKLPDRQWHEHLHLTRPRGPQGKDHWSLGCLCVDIPALTTAYAATKRATAIDYYTKGVLRWVITDDANGQSKLHKPPNYVDPLEKASECAGRFVRLSRLWEKAPEQAGIDAFEAADLAGTLLQEHGVPEATREDQKRPTGALLMALRDVKQTRVTYLELAGYEEAFGSRAVYNDAVVNIFTRLNAAGRTLKPEDITFAWLKVGWDTACTDNQSAKACVEELAEQLKDLLLPIPAQDVVSAVSFVWSVSFNSGKLLTNDDLVKGEAIRPMAANVSENWPLVVEAATSISAQAKDRGLRFREHYQSVNALAYLWAWYFTALRWRKQRALRELQRDELNKSLTETLDALMDRWLICSQWAGVWASASAQSLGGYATRLAECAQALANRPDVTSAVDELKLRLESELKDIEQAAVNGLMNIHADDRQEVRVYHTPLWLWNRLDEARWKMAKVALREQSRRQNTLQVDHIVAWDLWRCKLGAAPGEEVGAEINELGNCMLLEKNFNISKSNQTLRAFLEKVHDFKNCTYTIANWAKALDLEMGQVDSTDTSVETLRLLFTDRTQKIRSDLEQFVRGTKSRVDLESNLSPGLSAAQGS